MVSQKLIAEVSVVSVGNGSGVEMSMTSFVQEKKIKKAHTINEAPKSLFVILDVNKCVNV